MPTESIDAKGLIRAMLARGWLWCGDDRDQLTHPTNHGFYLRYDEPADKLTVSPELDEHLKLVIPTPRSKSKTFL